MRAQYDYRKDCVMKGYVTKLCDVDSIEIPEEMLEVHVDAERIEAEINDALIASIGIEGVSTVEGYRTYLTAKATDEANMENSKAIMRYLMDGMINGSEFEYDEAAMNAAVEQANEYYRLFSKTL